MPNMIANPPRIIRDTNADRLTADKLRSAICKVLTEDSYKAQALRLQSAIQKTGGVTQAADIIELAIATGKPVLREVAR